MENAGTNNLLSISLSLIINDEATYTLHDYLKSGYKGVWYYIEQEYYNNYIVNDKVYKNYSDFQQV